MIVYRLTKSKYCNDLSGKGAEITGGRWNSKGVAVIYTSESRALCVAEIAVHMQLNILPDDFTLITIKIPDEIEILELNPGELPPEWNTVPYSAKTRRIGDKFVSKNSNAVLKVPSAVVPGDFNYLINPNHEQAMQVRIVKVDEFSFDKRLFINKE